MSLLNKNTTMESIRGESLKLIQMIRNERYEGQNGEALNSDFHFNVEKKMLNAEDFEITVKDAEGAALIRLEEGREIKVVLNRSDWHYHVTAFPPTACYLDLPVYEDEGNTVLLEKGRVLLTDENIKFA